MSPSLGHDVVILACAISAGIHGALVPAHLAESDGAGAGFVAATAVQVLVVVALTHDPAAGPPLVAAALLLAGLIATYAVAITTGLPVLHPEPEPVDGLALFTKATEGLGLVTASALLGARPRQTRVKGA